MNSADLHKGCLKNSQMIPSLRKNVSKNVLLLAKVGEYQRIKNAMLPQIFLSTPLSVMIHRKARMGIVFF